MAEEVPKKIIMVVDDEQEIRESLQKTLSREGFEVVLAESGPDCTNKLETIRPDLILLDIFMYPWDGWRTLDEIKKNPETQDIPISMLTVVPLTIEDFEDKPIERSKFVYIENYLVKPINRDDLLRAVRDIIGLEEYLKKVVNLLIQNKEEKGAKDFEKAARNLYRNRKLKQSLVKCLVEEAKNIERVRKVIELQERNIELSMLQIRALEGRYRKYGIRLVGGK
jgi:two-component system, OmpR family, response regulator